MFVMRRLFTSASADKAKGVDLKVAEELLRNRKVSVARQNSRERSSKEGISKSGEDVEEEEQLLKPEKANHPPLTTTTTTAAPDVTVGGEDDTFYTVKPTSIPYTFESFPKIDLERIVQGNSQFGSVEIEEEDGGNDQPEEPVTETIEFVYPSAEDGKEQDVVVEKEEVEIPAPTTFAPTTPQPPPKPAAAEKGHSGEQEIPIIQPTSRKVRFRFVSRNTILRLLKFLMGNNVAN